MLVKLHIHVWFEVYTTVIHHYSFISLQSAHFTLAIRKGGGGQNCGVLSCHLVFGL